MDFLNPLKGILDRDLYPKLLTIIAITTVGIILIRLVSYLLNILLQKLQAQHRFIIKKFIIYSMNIVLVIILLSYIGVDLTAILGTVGILGIIIGIASQSAIGNIISGIFLISEGAFQLGDVIRVDAHFGVVHSIDLLAIKIKTFDNLLLRIPNQTLLSSKLINITKFPFRRQDLEIRVPMDADLVLIQDTLLNIVATTEACLNHPEPQILFKEFSSTGILINFGVWFEKANYLQVKNDIFLRVQKDFAEHNIQIPYMQIQVNPNYTTTPPKTN